MSFEYHEPTSIAEAVATVARLRDDARFLAGGTDLIIQIRRGRLQPRHVVSLHRVPGLDGIAGGDDVTLGALVTHRRVERAQAFQGALRGLVEGAEVIGGHQVRNVATVGGNIVNASPAADLVPVLQALDAEITCVGPDGDRRLPLEGFASAPGVTARRADELLSQVRFAALPPCSATAFLKAGRRRAMEISVVCVAVRLTLDSDLARCLEARVVLGAVGPTTLRARAAERALEGAAITPATLGAAGRAAAGECRPISDVRASAGYRALLVETLVPRALRRCVDRVRAAAAA